MFRWLSLAFAIFLSFLTICCVPQGSGGIRVISNVPDAVLYVDEEIKGPAQAFKNRYIYVSVGEHRLMLEHPDHFPEFAKVDVPAKRGIAVRFEMRRRPE